MNEHNIIFKKATSDDKNEIAQVLLDFYNMNDLNEAINAFSSEFEKDFHYIVAIEQDKIIGLITLLMHGWYLLGPQEEQNPTEDIVSVEFQSEKNNIN